MWTLEGFDTADPETATGVLTACCASRAWAEKVATGRPYGTFAALRAAALAGFDELDDAEVAVAHAAHPRIGGPPGGTPGPGAPADSRPGAGRPSATGAADAPARAGRPAGSGRPAAAPPGSTEAEWSRSEQSRAMTAGDAVKAELAAANAAYERRFGRVFLICATGLTAEEILAEARRRLANDDATERAEARAELRRIVALRLAKAFGAETPGEAR
ncbi:2-oxo-4-hydroxy-4-carboxy-5-ureidoimidazoline decarboxylase [Glycomyces terrestris]|uniref:2-oxo-4-hydroxy-4-carboxy-5-ureidoimidazoline decarboxylase n=1 Tax=Glycomyces terrestris TaxID=2493553 RepID=A0A426UU09_9ACTN|nr:2-oxo-4-hydroxy-4-carboxy-5-ureidoimidazoline decarboxylase [Glycomyces terrestris]RRR97462.1 2-oxo-4-hydroxy-4-carboxy-5-ureidoimidazoline decarboxylase [Glycomyces terrestris]